MLQTLPPAASEQPSKQPRQLPCFYAQEGSRPSFSPLDAKNTRQRELGGCLWPNEVPQEGKGQTLHAPGAWKRPEPSLRRWSGQHFKGGVQTANWPYWSPGGALSRAVYPIQTACFSIVTSAKGIWTKGHFLKKKKNTKAVRTWKDIF